MRFGTREMVFVVVLLAMPVAAYFFVFEPRNNQIAEAREEIRQKQLKLKQLEQTTRSISDLGQEIDKLTEAINLFEQKLPAEREVEVILKQVAELAAKQKLVAKSFRTDKPVATAQYTEQPINMVISGDFDGFYNFLIDLEKLSRITRMPEMKLKRGKTDKDGQVEAAVVLTIFFESKAGDSTRASSTRDRL
jgi:type IV pilus assembly protein PilO